METDRRRELGRIKRVTLGREGHGILGLYVEFDFGGSGQAMGWLALDSYEAKRDRRVGTASGLDLVIRLLDLFDVDTLDKIEGRVAFALRDSDDWNSLITGIELPPFDEGRRFTLAEWRTEWADEIAAAAKAARR